MCLPGSSSCCSYSIPVLFTSSITPLLCLISLSLFARVLCVSFRWLALIFLPCSPFLLHFCLSLPCCALCLLYVFLYISSVPLCFLSSGIFSALSLPSRLCLYCFCRDVAQYFASQLLACLNCTRTRRHWVARDRESTFDRPLRPVRLLLCVLLENASGHQHQPCADPS